MEEVLLEALNILIKLLLQTPSYSYEDQTKITGTLSAHVISFDCTWPPKCKNMEWTNKRYFSLYSSPDFTWLIQYILSSLLTSMCIYKWCEFLYAYVSHNWGQKPLGPVCDVSSCWWICNKASSWSIYTIFSCNLQFSFSSVINNDSVLIRAVMNYCIIHFC